MEAFNFSSCIYWTLSLLHIKTSWFYQIKLTFSAWKLQMKSSSAINLYKHRLLDWLAESQPQQIIFYLVTELTFPPFYPIYNSVVLDATWADWHNETFWNCQYNSFKKWQSLKETVRVELIFNRILFSPTKYFYPQSYSIKI